jgi:hypothetical protein
MRFFLTDALVITFFFFTPRSGIIGWLTLASSVVDKIQWKTVVIRVAFTRMYQHLPTRSHGPNDPSFMRVERGDKHYLQITAPSDVKKGRKKNTISAFFMSKVLSNFKCI